MADENFQIKITTTTDTAGVEQTKKALGEITQTTETSGKAAVKAEAEVAAATKKTITSKQHLKEALREVGREFPIVGAVARLALNPIVASAAAITVALRTIRDKLTDTSTSFADAKWGTEKINEGAEAWGRYATQISAAKLSSDGLATNLAKITGYMAAIDKYSKSQGGQGGDDNPLYARRQSEAQAAAMETASKNAADEAQRLTAEARKTLPHATEVDDRNTQRKVDEDARKAQIAKDANDKEIEWLQQRQEAAKGIGSGIADLGEMAKFNLKYGATTNPQSVIDQLQNENATYDNAIQQAEDQKRRADTREAQRKAADAMMERAKKEEEESKRLAEDAAKTRFDGQVAYAVDLHARGINPPVRNTPTPTSFGVEPAAEAYWQKAKADSLRLAREWATFLAAMQSELDAVKSRAATSDRLPR